jgi:uracil permease
VASDRIVQTDEKLPLLQVLPLSAQHLMAMFGATVLVPYLTGLNPGIGLMTSGIGTIIYLICVRNKIPSFLGSSFAFIAPLAAVIGKVGVDGVALDPSRIPYALGGLVAAGVVYMIVAGIVKVFGTRWLDKILPPAVVGAVVIVIGLGLSGSAIKMALYPGATPANGVSLVYVGIAFFTLASAVVFSSFFKGFTKTIPILLAIVAGYVVCLFIPGMLNFKPVADAAWIGLPPVVFPKFEFNAIMVIAPVALVVIVEHIGHLMVINEITGKDFTPLLPESLFGDGLATFISGLLGGTPSTTYAENIGVMAVTKVYATQLFWYAGALAIIVGGFVPKLSALISSIPTPVMGGISLLLFGLIATSGLRLLVKSGIDYGHSRNLIMSSVILVVGIGMETGGYTIPFGQYTIPGMTLAALLGVVLNLVLPKESEGLAIDSPDFTGESQAEAGE